MRFGKCDRERLIELIIEAKATDPETGSFAEYLADYLLAHSEIFVHAHPADPKREIARKILLHIGVAPHLKGYNLLLEAIVLRLSTDSHLSMSRHIYPALAERFHIPASHIERNMRTSIERAFAVCPPDVLEEVFGNTMDPQKDMLNNMAFIYRISELVRQEYERMVRREVQRSIVED